jgi:phytol kinase
VPPLLPVRPFAILLVVAGQVCVLGAAELIGRRGLRPEHTRRIAHAAGGASVAVLPRLLTLGELAVLAALFTGVLAWTLRRRWLGSVHGVRRATAGVLVFPAGLLLGAWLGWGHPVAIAYAALVLALADPAAALAGERLGGPGWPVVGGRKTAAGSAAFLVVAVAVGVALTGLSPGRLPAVMGAALLLTAVEASIGYGLDNLPLPAVASLLAVGWLGL